MSHDFSMNKSTPSASAGEDDDWETADIESFKPKSITKTQARRMETPLVVPILRPSAPEFKPRPAPSSTPAPTVSASASTSRSTSGSGVQRGPKILARPPRTQPPTTDANEEVEDEWFGTSRRPISNRQIWDSANSITTPHTTIIASNTNTTLATPLPPAPVMQILRRPAKESKRSNSGSGSGSNTPTNKTLSEREEEYRLARERIFANSNNKNVVETSIALEALSIVPHQVGLGGAVSGSGRIGAPRRSPGPGDTLIRTGSPAGAGSGIVRQPRGPGGGAGFGAV